MAYIHFFFLQTNIHFEFTDLIKSKNKEYIILKKHTHFFYKPTFADLYILGKTENTEAILTMYMIKK